MESSSLVKAHDHALAAAVATRQASDTTVAINEHALAAGEFANAARSTSSVEALRTLKLLEEHHRKLAEILKLPPEQTSQNKDGDAGEKQHSEKDPSSSSETEHSNKDDSVEHRASRTAQPPGLGQQRRYASREMSSSIASNLASARGIRSKYRGQPLSPSISNDQAPGNVDPHSHKDGSKAKMQNIMDTQSGRPTWVPPMTSSSKQEGRPKTAASSRADTGSAPVDDGGYARFYNTFGNLINKISAPLAFAGLPLIQEESVAPSEPPESPEVSPTKRNRVRASRSPSMEPDLSKIYSKATLRALAREGHTAANDSFYVVPTTGHTMSYANILSYAEKEKRRMEALSLGELGDITHEEDDDDFVDARETMVPASPGQMRRSGRLRADRELSNTIEELTLENKSLKDMLDKLTKRLHTFEASAQNSALALAESYRIMRPGSPLSVTGSKVGDDLMKKKNQELEEQLVAATKQMERLEKDNRKMQKTLEKYREKWDTLKAGAKARREAQGTGESVEDARQS